MHTVELLEQAIALAERLGFVVRQDWLGGRAAGACELKGRRWLFVDLSLSPAEQLEQVLDALGGAANKGDVSTTPQMRKMLNLRKAA